MTTRILATTRSGAVAALLAGALLAPAGLDRTAHAQLTRAQTEQVIALTKEMAAQPEVIDAVAASNAKRVPMAEVMRLQADWKAGKTPELARALMTNDCAKRLAAMQVRERGILEVAVHDNQGVRVCVTNKTSNYWRGDKAKFTDAYRNGRGAVFVSQPEYDASTQEYTTEISVPVMRGGRAIGVVGIELLTKKQ